MNKEQLIQQTVGGIVTQNFAAAKVFRNLGLDFCCHGEVPFVQACQEKGLNPEQVIEQVVATPASAGGSCPFDTWPTDLLIDYVLKIHHRNIRNNSDELLALLDKVARVHGDNHPYLKELQEQVHESIDDLLNHLAKEENVLFPFILDMFDADQNNRPAAPMHCGSVQNPIAVMRMEHENEGNRYHHIIELTDNYTTPADGCGSYRLLMQELEAFMNALFEHIHIENNIIFPRAIALERKLLAGE